PTRRSSDLSSTSTNVVRSGLSRASAKSSMSRSSPKVKSATTVNGASGVPTTAALASDLLAFAGLVAASCGGGSAGGAEGGAPATGGSTSVPSPFTRISSPLSSVTSKFSPSTVSSSGNSGGKSLITTRIARASNVL